MDERRRTSPCWVDELCVFIGVWLMYIITVAPSVAGGDSGELLAEACHLGTAHPPGYPLFTMLMHPVLHLPMVPGLAIETPAAWANVACAAFGAAAAAVLAGTVRDLCKILFGVDSGRWSGAAAAGLYAFSPLVWQYAATSEVFSLNNLLNTLITRSAIDFAVNRTRASIRRGALWCGLALTNQHTAILFVVPMVVWMLVVLRDELRRRPQELVLLGTLVALGLAPYAYLPLRAALHPRPGSWGDVTSIRGFFHHLLRKDYGTLRLYSGSAGASEGLGPRLRAYGRDVAYRQSSIRMLLPALSVFGFLVLLFFYPPLQRPVAVQRDSSSPMAAQKSSKARRRARMQAYNESKRASSRGVDNAFSAAETNDDPSAYVGAALVATLAFYLVVFHALANLPLSDPLLFGIHSRFWMQPNILVCLSAGIGVESVAVVVAHVVPRNLPSVSPLAASDGKTTDTPSHHKFAARASIVLIALQLRLGLRPHADDPGAPAGTLSWRFGLARSPPAWYFHDYARALLAPLPRDALLLVNYDQQWTSVRYAQICERFRPDITVLQLSMMTYRWWQTKRELYPGISWPGTHYTKENTVAWAEGAFDIRGLLDANYARFPGIYLGGKLSFADQGYKSAYEFVPHGLVSKVFALGDVPSLHKYILDSRRVWNATLDQFRRLPFEEEGYSRETWEWTITREVFDHVAERASYVLERAIEMNETAPRRLRHLVEAAQWLEYCIKYDPNLPTHTVKNSGLADVHLVRSTTDKHKPPAVPDLLGNKPILSANMSRFADLHPRALGAEWKTWASERFTLAWGEFLERKDATDDPQYDTIRHIFDSVARLPRSKAHETLP
ncbi:hypothetical protein CTAYLR_005324 [Chrysophaeum taylorii]|uniref:DUF2723 domain-containing protein n=1 Tax=Chrysophaeum taylorii TaxID=2483200 RepID=A0AAD7XIE8_9STRA|nr:hypothetical protein CTAYLR_005324 [Chrysophaeum taylorii]